MAQTEITESTLLLTYTEPDVERRRVESLQYRVGWWDAVLGANKKFQLRNVDPRQAAMLLSGCDPFRERRGDDWLRCSSDLMSQDARENLDGWCCTTGGRRPLIHWHRMAAAAGHTFHPWIGEYIKDAPMVALALEHLPDEPVKPTKQPYKRAKLIADYKHRWPSIESDLKNASNNGLSAARVGSRGWDVDKAIEWANANNKISAATVPQQASPLPTMASVGSRVYMMGNRQR